MSKRTAGAALTGLAVVLVVVAFAYRAWQTSDGQESKRETEAFTKALVTDTRYTGPEDPDLTGVYLLAGAAAVFFLSGIVLVAVSPPPDAPDASDRPSPEPADP